MASSIQKPISINNQSQESTIYLVADGNQVQLVQVPNNVQKPVIFRNQNGQILQERLIPAASITNQPVFVSSQTNENVFILSNSSKINIPQQQQISSTSLMTQQPHESSSQAISTAHTSSSFDINPKSSTNVTAKRTIQSLTSHTQLPAAVFPTSNSLEDTLQSSNSDTSSIYNDNDTYEVDDSTTTAHDDLTLSQITQRANHHHYQQLNCSSLLKKKRQRTRSYEHDQSTNKRIRSCSLIERTELTNPNGFQSHNSLSTSVAVDQTRNSSILYPTSSNLPTSTITTNVIQSYLSSMKSFDQEQNSIIIHQNKKDKKNFNLCNDPNQWSIFDVKNFISSITDDKIAEFFYNFQINGAALLLIQEKHLRNDMKINLGPSIIILDKILKLREHSSTFDS
ncbi:unnamed protein product [Rotaria sp. Silwood1]|nr:unnamed protein product [Rotaria sp. Silwood1]